MFDLLIKNARIIDGTTSPVFDGEIGIQNGRIQMIRRKSESDYDDSPAPEAEKVIDAEGNVVCPGFIDLHSHADRKILDKPAAESSLLMGVTTEITGNCGNSIAPLSDASARFVKSRFGTEVSWRSMDDFLSKVEETAIGNNHGLFVGQGSIRAAVMGREKRFPAESELNRMKEMAQESMEAGAFGISTGRAYVPGCYSGFREVTEVTRVVGDHLGLYTSHIADQWANVHRATWEVVEIGLRTGAPVQVAHQKVVGKDNWGRSDEVLAILEEGRQMGADVTADVYPYPHSQVMPLKRALPKELRGQDADETLHNLKQEDSAESIRKSFKENPTYVTERLVYYGIIQCAKTKKYEGLDLGEVAIALGTDVPGAVRHLLLENEMRVKIAGIMDEDDVADIVAHPLVMIGSDSSLRSYAEDQESDEDWPMVHPREYGTFPRVLGKYVREKGILTLEEAVHKMTAMPAERIELPDRGLITRGFWADLVIFDPDTIDDTATAEEPCRAPKGLHYVLVNGEVSVKDNDTQSTRAGQLLRDSQARMLY